MLNPLSPLTYYRRHKRQALLLVSLIVLVTLGICIMVGALYPIMEYTSIYLDHLTHFSLVYPAGSLLDPTIASQIRAHPDVAHVIPENGLHINVPSLVGSSSFRVLGVSEAGVQILTDVCDVRLKEGRLLEPRTNEIVLSEEIARALGLQIGDPIDHTINKRYYGNIKSPLVLVGILESDPSVSSEQARLALVSYEYLQSHELYAPRQSGLIVIAKENRKKAVDEFLENTISSPRTHVETYGQESGFVVRTRQMFYTALVTVDCLVAVVVALVVGMINQIALTQRLADLGLLHALGHRKNRLIRRLTLETAVVAGVSWIIGLILAWLALAWLKTNFYEPRGMELNLANLIPLWFAIPIPLMVIGFATYNITRVFARLDAVAIIERGELSTEAQGQRGAAKRSRATRSSVKPLSSWTFYLRHRRRGLLLVAAIALMTLGVASLAFFASPIFDTQKPFLLNSLRYVSRASPGVGRAVDPGVIGQIRSHSAVARVIPYRPLWLTFSVPPATESSMSISGVSEDDLLYLVDLFGLHLEEGRLPRARSNEIVLSEAIAMNRGLRVGDTVGEVARYRWDDIPTEMKIVGIFFHSDVALGFASYEYLESHELTSSRPVRLLVVPVEGRKAELDTWLEESVASTQTSVRTYEARFRWMQQMARGALLLCAAVEAIIAVVAAIALASLNYIFFAQRQEEFGILHAMGHSRPWLVLRTVRESVSVAAMAWLIGAAVCLAGLIYAQANVYAPMGLSLDISNPAPWLFTLPIPLAVVAASAGTIAWTLSRLDPVAVIERR